MQDPTGWLVHNSLKTYLQYSTTGKSVEQEEDFSMISLAHNPPNYFNVCLNLCPFPTRKLMWIALHHNTSSWPVLSYQPDHSVFHSNNFPMPVSSESNNNGDDK